MTVADSDGWILGKLGLKYIVFYIQVDIKLSYVHNSYFSAPTKVQICTYLCYLDGHGNGTQQQEVLFMKIIISSFYVFNTH